MQNTKSYEQQLAEYRTLMAHRDELVDGHYRITLRYDRTVLAVAGGAIALLATNGPNDFLERISILLFISSIISIMLCLHFGAEAHRKAIDAIRNNTFDNSNPSENFVSYSGLLSKYLAKISLALLCFDLFRSARL